MQHIQTIYIYILYIYYIYLYVHANDVYKYMYIYIYTNDIYQYIYTNIYILKNDLFFGIRSNSRITFIVFGGN